MDKTEKLALARKKLRKFQAKGMSPSLDSSIEFPSNGLNNHTPKITRTNDTPSSLPSQVHSQSLDILVTEKTDLIQRLTQTQAELRQKQQDCFTYQTELSNLQRQLEQSNAEKQRIHSELEQKNKSNITDKEIRDSLHSTRKTLEDTMEENKELLNRIATQSKEINELSQTKAELQSKLTMNEILLHQLQNSPSLSQPTTPTDNKGNERIEELEGELSRLMATIGSMKRERDQAMSDIAALREALLTTQQENARKVGNLQTLVKESEIEIGSLTQQLSSNTSSTDLKEREVSSLQQSLEAISRERDDLKTRLQQLVSDNARLSELYSTAEDSVTQLEAELSRAKGEVIDQQSLMATISQDKESISRAVAQNKELKEQLAELQEAFVQKSHLSMELASSLETEKYQKQKLNERMDVLEKELKTEKERHEETIAQLMTERNSRKQDPPTQEILLTQGVSPVQSLDEEGHANVSQIQELSMECTSLREERDKLLEELRRLTSPSPSVMDQDDDDTTNNTTPVEGDTSLLQQSFSALQERFTCVMKDKADLLDRLQVMEHTVIQLSGENETIAEYVSLYQTQREALKVKFSEKDRIIEQLHQDKNKLQIKLREVQLMLSRIDHTPSVSHDQHSHHELPPNDSAHPPSLPAHLSTERGVVGKVVSLIEEELTFPSSTTSLSTTAQCPCCSGQLIVI